MKLCVIDTRFPLEAGMFAFCPFRVTPDGREEMTELAMYASVPPDGWELDARVVWHPDGERAALAWAREYEPELLLLANLMDARDGV